MTTSPETGKKVFVLRASGLKQAELRDIIAGQYQGAYAAFARAVFRPVSVLYRFAVQSRNCLYDTGSLRTHKISVPVISVGNITAGGTGKTPLVIWLAKYISPKKKCAIITRGYKAARDSVDEPSLLARSVSDTPVVVNPDRVAGARLAVNNGAEVLILDDAFQHRRLARDIDIVTVDATCPFGYGKVLPAGLLREPLGCLARADAVIITRADQVDKQRIDEIETTIKAFNSSLAVATAVHKPLTLTDGRGVELEPAYIKGKKVFAFCGIGNPDAFVTTLKSLGAAITGSSFYDDHYHYSKADIEQLAANAEATEAELAITTEKDFSKIEVQWLKNAPVDFAYLAVEIELGSGASQITQLIDKTIAGRISTNS
jgi:tetraacyldisaccharide 4'-kinase